MWITFDFYINHYIDNYIKILFTGTFGAIFEVLPGLKVRFLNRSMVLLGPLVRFLNRFQVLTGTFGAIFEVLLGLKVRFFFKKARFSGLFMLLGLLGFLG
jgi:hypothetical protein